jgi:hypothetical protein
MIQHTHSKRETLYVLALIVGCSCVTDKLLEFFDMCVEHPDMVQEFHAITQNSQSVMLEWKPPRKPGVLQYKVNFVLIISMLLHL